MRAGELQMKTFLKVCLILFLGFLGGLGLGATLGGIGGSATGGLIGLCAYHGAALQSGVTSDPEGRLVAQKIVEKLESVGHGEDKERQIFRWLAERSEELDDDAIKVEMGEMSEACELFFRRLRADLAARSNASATPAAPDSPAPAGAPDAPSAPTAPEGSLSAPEAGESGE